MMVRRSTVSAPKRRYDFMLRSLIIFLLMVIVTAVQFFLITSTSYLTKFFKDDKVLCPIFFCVALFHSVVYLFASSVRQIVFLNWLMALFIVECLIISLGSTVVTYEFVEWFGSIIFVLFIMAIIYTIALFTPHDFTYDFINLFVVTYILFIAAIYFLLRFSTDTTSFCFYIVFLIIMIVVCMFVLYHAQCIIGGKYAEVRKTDFLLAALTLYVDFILLYIAALQFAPRVLKIVQGDKDARQVIVKEEEEEEIFEPVDPGVVYSDMS